MKLWMAMFLLCACGREPSVPVVPVPTQETPPVVVVSSPTPTPTPTVTPDPTPTPTPDPTPTPTPTPPPFVGCTLSSSGSATSTFNQFIGKNGQNVVVTLVGTLSCTTLNPDVFWLHTFQIQTYCLVSNHCTITMNSLTLQGGVYSVTSATNSHDGIVRPILTTNIPVAYYQ